MKKYILILLVIGFANTLLGQVGLQVEGSKYSIIKKGNETADLNFSNKIDLKKSTMEHGKLPPSLSSVFLKSNDEHKQGTYFSNKKNRNGEMAFFCDIELKIEKASKLPIRFRLGDVQTVDRKEGKWQQFDH